MYHRCCGEIWYAGDEGARYCERCGQYALVVHDGNEPTKEGLEILASLARDSAIRTEQERTWERRRPRKHPGKYVDKKCRRCGRPRILKGHERRRGMLSVMVPQDFPRVGQEICTCGLTTTPEGDPQTIMGFDIHSAGHDYAESAKEQLSRPSLPQEGRAKSRAPIRFPDSSKLQPMQSRLDVFVIPQLAKSAAQFVWTVKVRTGFDLRV